MPPTPSTRAYLATVAESSAAGGGAADFRKVYARLGPDHFVKASTAGIGADQRIPKASYLHQIQLERGLESRALLRRELAGMLGFALMLANIAPSVELQPHKVHLRSKLPQRRLSRDRGDATATLVDEPRAFFTLDIDKLVTKQDLLEDFDELPNVLFNTLDAAGLDWLIADCIVHMSSSFGLMDRTTLRAHVEWELANPLSLAEQKRLSKVCSAAFEAAGMGPVTDTVIYDAARVTFTAPPLIVELRDGRRHPVEPPRFERVRLVRKGQALIVPPKEFLDATPAERTRIAVRRLTSAPGKPKQFGAIGYETIRDRIFAVAMKTPAHKEDEAREALRQQLLAELAIAMQSPEDTARRMEYLEPKAFKDSWDGAWAQRRVSKTKPSKPRAVQHPAAGVRDALGSTMAALVRAAMEHAETLDPDNPALPAHTLIRIPPGVGKTQAALAAILPQHLSSHRIHYLGATSRLSAEATARKLSTLPTDEWWQGMARHHIGRKQLCISEEYDALAVELERVGRSPLRDVCGVCPMKDACRWPQQHADKSSGLVAQQHAHATTSMAKLRAATEGAPDLVIIDESILGSLLKEPQVRRLGALARITSKTVVRGEGGEISLSRTNDVRTYRSRLMEMLSKARPTLSRAETLWLMGRFSMRFMDQTTEVHRLSDALGGEADVQRSYGLAVSRLVGEAHAARQQGKSGHKQVLEIRRATAAIQVSQFFAGLYRAVQATHAIPGRQHIFGVRVAGDRVSLNTRQSLPSILGSRHTIWLDGTARPDTWQAMMQDVPGTKHVVDMAVAPGAYHLTQYPDRSYGKRFFLGGDSTPQRGDSHLMRLRLFILARAAAHFKAGSDTDVLVVTQKPVRDALAQYAWPGNVAFEHFNALRGLDKYKSVPCAIVVGRPAPSGAVLETLTEALHFDDPACESIASSFGVWTTATKMVSLADGTDREVTAEAHPDPRVEALRQQIVDAEVQQALLRLRLFDRDEACKAELHLFGTVNSGLLVHSVQDWEDAARTLPEVVSLIGVQPKGAEMWAKVAWGCLSGAGERTIERVRSKTRHIPLREHNALLYYSGDMAGFEKPIQHSRTVDWSDWLVRFEGARLPQYVKVRSDIPSEQVVERLKWALGVKVERATKREIAAKGVNSRVQGDALTVQPWVVNKSNGAVAPLQAIPEKAERSAPAIKRKVAAQPTPTPNPRHSLWGCKLE